MHNIRDFQKRNKKLIDNYPTHSSIENLRAIGQTEQG